MNTKTTIITVGTSFLFLLASFATDYLSAQEQQKEGKIIEKIVVPKANIKPYVVASSNEGTVIDTIDAQKVKSYSCLVAFQSDSLYISCDKFRFYGNQINQKVKVKLKQGGITKINYEKKIID